MRVTKDGRPFCEIRDPMGQNPIVRVEPILYDVLRKVTEGRLTCSVDLNFREGGLGNAHVKMSAEKFASGPVNPLGATLQAG